MSPVTPGVTTQGYGYRTLPSQSWLRFLTSAVLPLATLALFAAAAALYFGVVYLAADVSRGRIYGVFPAMEMVDKTFAAITIGLAILSIVTRKSLKWHHSNAVTLATVFSASCLAVYLAYSAAVSVVIGRPAFDAYSFVVTAVSGCWIAINLIYLNKRRMLFVIP